MLSILPSLFLSSVGSSRLRLLLMGSLLLHTKLSQKLLPSYVCFCHTAQMHTRSIVWVGSDECFEGARCTALYLHQWFFVLYLILSVVIVSKFLITLFTSNIGQGDVEKTLDSTGRLMLKTCSATRLTSSGRSPKGESWSWFIGNQLIMYFVIIIFLSPEW